MKYFFFIPDGLGDYPIKQLGGKTILEYANVPNLHSIAKKGFVGLLKTVPDGMDPGSDVAGLSLLGFDPHKYYTGRAPLEAASMGVQLKPNELAFRMNTVRIENGEMADFSGGHPASEKSAKFVNLFNEKIADLGIKVHPGIMYRHLLVISEDKLQGNEGELELTPPHNISGQKVDPYQPKRAAVKVAPDREMPGKSAKA